MADPAYFLSSARIRRQPPPLRAGARRTPERGPRTPQPRGAAGARRPGKEKGAQVGSAPPPPLRNPRGSLPANLPFPGGVACPGGSGSGRASPGFHFQGTRFCDSAAGAGGLRASATPRSPCTHTRTRESSGPGASPLPGRLFRAEPGRSHVGK